MGNKSDDRRAAIVAAQAARETAEREARLLAGPSATSRRPGARPRGRPPKLRD